MCSEVELQLQEQTSDGKLVRALSGDRGSVTVVPVPSCAGLEQDRVAMMVVKPRCCWVEVEAVWWWLAMAARLKVARAEGTCRLLVFKLVQALSGGRGSVTVAPVPSCAGLEQIGAAMMVVKTSCCWVEVEAMWWWLAMAAGLKVARAEGTCCWGERRRKGEVIMGFVSKLEASTWEMSTWKWLQ